MKASIDFTEILDIVQNKFHVRPQIKYVGPKAFEVIYQQTIFSRTIKIADVIVTVEEINGSTIKLAYECDFAMKMLISGLIGKVREVIPSGVDIIPDTQKVIIELNEIKELEKALEFVVLEDINVESDGLDVKCKLLL